MHIIIACILNCCSFLTFKHAQMVLIYKNKIKISLLCDLLNLLLLSSPISEKSPHTWCSHSTSVLRVIWLLTPSHQQIAPAKVSIDLSVIVPSGCFQSLPVTSHHHSPLLISPLLPFPSSRLQFNVLLFSPGFLGHSFFVFFAASSSSTRPLSIRILNSSF